MPIIKNQPIWLGNSTWANRGTPANNARKFISDIGIGGVDMRYDANRDLWLPVGGNGITHILSGVPMVRPPSGSFDDNGAITLVTALPTTYSTGCYLLCQADAIAVGVPDGMYFAIMSSPTQGIVYNNTWTESVGMPSIIANPTPFVCTGAGAYVADTSNSYALINRTVPAGLLGKLGYISTRFTAEMPNNANNKLLRTRLGTGTYALMTLTAATFVRYRTLIYNCGIEALNNSPPATSIVAPIDGVSTGVTYRNTINTASNQTLSITAQISNPADFIVLSFVHAEIFPGG